jgi:hypothetical protein
MAPLPISAQPSEGFVASPSECANLHHVTDKSSNRTGHTKSLTTAVWRSTALQTLKNKDHKTPTSSSLEHATSYQQPAITAGSNPFLSRLVLPISISPTSASEAKSTEKFL